MDARTRRQREADRLSVDVGVLELERLCHAMARLADRIGRFRRAHNTCRTTGRGRCLLCAALPADFGGTDPFDMLGAAHTALSLASDLVDNDRPLSARELTRSRREILADIAKLRAEEMQCGASG